jgi:hypothetical protein
MTKLLDVPEDTSGEDNHMLPASLTRQSGTPHNRRCVGNILKVSPFEI